MQKCRGMLIIPIKVYNGWLYLTSESSSMNYHPWPCSFPSNSLIFLIIAMIMCMEIILLHVNYHFHQIKLLKFTEPCFFIELRQKQIFHFSLIILTLPFGIHLKNFTHRCTQYSIFYLFTFCMYVLHYLAL